jgi:hypothetical protein
MEKNAILTIVESCCLRDSCLPMAGQQTGRGGTSFPQHLRFSTSDRSCLITVRDGGRDLRGPCRIGLFGGGGLSGGMDISIRQP